MAQGDAHRRVLLLIDVDVPRTKKIAARDRSTNGLHLVYGLQHPLHHHKHIHRRGGDRGARRILYSDPVPTYDRNGPGSPKLLRRLDQAQHVGHSVREYLPTDRSAVAFSSRLQSPGTDAPTTSIHAVLAKRGVGPRNRFARSTKSRGKACQERLDRTRWRGQEHFVSDYDVWVSCEDGTCAYSPQMMSGVLARRELRQWLDCHTDKPRRRLPQPPRL
jgi:hypothetical protein